MPSMGSVSSVVGSSYSPGVYHRPILDTMPGVIDAAYRHSRAVRAVPRRGDRARRRRVELLTPREEFIVGLDRRLRGRRRRWQPDATTRARGRPPPSRHRRAGGAPGRPATGARHPVRSRGPTGLGPACPGGRRRRPVGLDGQLRRDRAPDRRAPGGARRRRRGRPQPDRPADPVPPGDRRRRHHRRLRRRRVGRPAGGLEIKRELLAREGVHIRGRARAA